MEMIFEPKFSVGDIVYVDVAYKVRKAKILGIQFFAEVNDKKILKKRVEYKLYVEGLGGFNDCYCYTTIRESRLASSEEELFEVLSNQ